MVEEIDNRFVISLSKEHAKLKNILLMYNSFGIGGVENVIKNILARYSRKYNFYFVGECDVPDIWKKHFKKTYKLKFSSYNDRSSIDARILQLKKVFIDNNIDIFYNHYYYYPCQIYDIETAKECNVKTILHFHNSFEVIFNQKFMYAYMPQLYESFKSYDKIICLSSKSERFFRIINNNSHYFPNIYDKRLDEIRQIDKNRNGVLWVGRLDVNQKRPYDAIEIFNQLAKCRIDQKMTLCYSTNEWTDDIEKYMLDLAKQYGIYSRISFIKDKHDEDIWNQMLHHKVLIYTSTFDGYPMTILEAKKCRMNIVAYRQQDCDILNDVAQTDQKDIDAICNNVLKALNSQNIEKEYDVECPNLEDILS